MKPKILVIVGPTSSGKSDLAVQLARRFNGEVISADSRQVYRGLDTGTGKITRCEMRGVPHHLLDVASPRRRFNVVDFQKKADAAIADILKRGKLPIIAGGTGFYIQAIVDGIILPELSTNTKLRKQLEKLSLKELQEKLRRLDPKRFRKIDKQNPVRLIRAIEISSALGNVPPVKKQPKYDAIQIGLNWPKEKLHKRIQSRLRQRMRAGLVKEVRDLHTNGLSWRRMESLGLEYRYVSRYLRGQMSKREMVAVLGKRIEQYAKRQITWFRRDDRVKWINIKSKIRVADLKNVFKIIDNFLNFKK